jgi:hypothetical protein
MKFVAAINEQCSCRIVKLNNPNGPRTSVWRCCYNRSEIKERMPQSMMDLAVFSLTARSQGFREDMQRKTNSLRPFAKLLRALAVRPFSELW